MITLKLNKHGPTTLAEKIPRRSSRRVPSRLPCMASRLEGFFGIFWWDIFGIFCMASRIFHSGRIKLVLVLWPSNIVGWNKHQKYWGNHQRSILTPNMLLSRDIIRIWWEYNEINFGLNCWGVGGHQSIFFRVSYIQYTPVYPLYLESHSGWWDYHNPYRMFWT